MEYRYEPKPPNDLGSQGELSLLHKERRNRKREKKKKTLREEVDNILMGQSWLLVYCLSKSIRCVYSRVRRAKHLFIH